MNTYKFYIVSDNDQGVLVKLCNMFTARGLSIQILHAAPINPEKTLSSIEMTVEMDGEKIQNMREKILQIVPIRDVKVHQITEII